MTRKQLQQLTKPEMIEIMLRQQALIEQLEVRVAELEEQIKHLGKAAQRPHQLLHSVLPKSQG